MGLVIRRAENDDLGAIGAIYDKTHDAEEAGLTTTGWIRGIYPVTDTARAALDRGDMYVAERDGKVVATGIINHIQVDVYADCEWVYTAPDDDVSVLHTLAVDPDARGAGIGPEFVRYWERTAREEGRSVLRIDTNARNKKARKMYASLGFMESGIVPTVFNGIHGVDLVMMEKFIGTDIQKRLREMRDIEYAKFQSALIPTVECERVIGVRTPKLRSYASELLKTSAADGFIDVLPHMYFDEMQLHAFIVSGIKDFDRCMAETERFLPYIDNWATCDQLSPKVFAKHKDILLEHIDIWLESEKTYILRFGVGMLMRHFLDEGFDVSYMNRIAEIRSDEYYVNMMIAWYFATALAKQYDAALPVLTEYRLDPWVHNKTIQKSIESFRITDDQKDHLRTLRLRKDKKESKTDNKK